MRTYFIKTFGCQMNSSDSERIASFLDKNGLKESEANSSAEALAKADLIIFNTCGVRQTAENRVYGQVHNLRKQNKKCIIVITGCLAHRKDVQERLREKANLFISINKITKLFKHLNLSNFPINNNCQLENNYLSLKPKYKNDNSAFVPIMTGCNNFCAYCVVPYARGREWSRPSKNIIKEIEKISENGCKEITLLGQNVNSYQYKASQLLSSPPAERGSSSDTMFPKLLELLAKKYPKIKFNFFTSHPKDFSDDLIKSIAENKNISREIHLPVQSGSNKILKLMNRPYTQKKYLDLIAKIKKQIPEVKISTDVIVGFPEETKKDFQETIKVFKKVGYFEAYINKYSPRPGTASFKLGDPISWDEKKRREKELRELIKK
jgi:tRNA-2-methylthio-N6-dimethylallyladenosine synthase